MRMYSAKQRASAPLSTLLPATEQLGMSTFFRPAAVTSPLMAEGVMSGVPTIFSAARLSWTVLWPATPTTMAPRPKAMRITLAAIPPKRTSLLMLPLPLPRGPMRIACHSSARRLRRHPGRLPASLRTSRPTAAENPRGGPAGRNDTAPRPWAGAPVWREPLGPGAVRLLDGRAPGGDGACPARLGDDGRLGRGRRDLRALRLVVEGVVLGTHEVQDPAAQQRGGNDDRHHHTDHRRDAAGRQHPDLGEHHGVQDRVRDEDESARCSVEEAHTSIFGGGGRRDDGSAPQTCSVDRRRPSVTPSAARRASSWAAASGKLRVHGPCPPPS